MRKVIYILILFLSFSCVTYTKGTDGKPGEDGKPEKNGEKGEDGKSVPQPIFKTP